MEEACSGESASMIRSTTRTGTLGKNAATMLLAVRTVVRTPNHGWICQLTLNAFDEPGADVVPQLALS